MTERSGGYGADSSLLDLIYGITYEIWEERGVELIKQYYGEDIRVFALGNVSDGAEAVVQSTHDTLEAFPDRLLLAENVIWSTEPDGLYSSHRIISPMTNKGPSVYGPPTGKKVSVRTIADCFVQDGVITREWLIRDTLPIVTQLGLDPLEIAKQQRQGLSETTYEYHQSELSRTNSESTHQSVHWTEQALSARWTGSNDIEHFFAPYAVSYPGPLAWLSGRDAIKHHGLATLGGLQPSSVRVDHVATQPWGHEGEEMAVRWTMTAEHTGPYLELKPRTEQRVAILGSVHWRIVDRKIATEWLVFDGMGVLAQLVD